MTNDRRMLASIGLALGDLAALRALWPDLGALARGVAAPHAWVAATGADGAASTLAGAALWCAALWLGVGLLAAAATRVPGGLGRISRAVSRVLLPAALYRVVAGAAGLGVLLAPVGAGAAGIGASSARLPGGASAAVTSPSTPSIPAPLWPVDAPRPTQSVPTPIWPGSPAPRAPVPRSPAPTGAQPKTSPVGANPRSADRPPQPARPADAPSPERGVLVRPGNSLWSLAAARLGEQPSAAQIAAAWPQWYAANRSVIGTDPNLIRPGQLLQPPTSTPGSQ